MPVLDLRLVKGDLQLLKREGCKAADQPPQDFMRLMKVTRDDPCEHGCEFFNRGKCPAYLKFHTREVRRREALEAKRKEEYTRAHTDQSGLIGGRWAGMSIRQIAEKEGISLNKAREYKRMGLYRGDNVEPSDTTTDASASATPG